MKLIKFNKMNMKTKMKIIMTMMKINIMILQKKYIQKETLIKNLVKKRERLLNSKFNLIIKLKKLMNKSNKIIRVINHQIYRKKYQKNYREKYHLIN